MILVSTSNKNMTRFIGQDVTTAYVGNGELMFVTEKGSYWKSVAKGSPVVAGNVVIIKTAHSAYNFRLKEGEKFVMGCTA